MNRKNEKKDMEGKIGKNTFSKYFVILTAISIATILISNITSIKLFSIGSIVLPTSALLFPISYILGDVITEVYGYKKAKFVILLGFLCNAFMVLFFTLSISLPSAPTWHNQDSYELILGTTPRMFIASLSAFLLGSLSNAYTMDFIKKITKGGKLWVRTIGSTMVGELFDTLVFVFIGFTGIMPFNVILTTIVCQYIWKVSYEILATPMTYFVVNRFRKMEKL